jgi:hypothetical protein
MAGLARDLSVQPRTRLCPFAAHRDRRDPNHLGDLFQVEAAEEPELDDLRFSRIALGQLPPSVVYRHEVPGAFDSRFLSFGDLDDADFATIAAFCAPTGDVHEDVAHQSGGHGHEMGAVLPTDVLPVHQANKRFVHQGSCLKDMARTLTPEIPARQLTELCLHQRDEPVQGGIVPFPPGNEQFGDLGAA